MNKPKSTKPVVPFVVYMSRNSAQVYDVTDCVVVSIADPFEEPRTPEFKGALGVLPLAFNPSYCRDCWIQKEDSEAITKLFEEHLGKAKAIVVHCVMGQSRSKSLATGIVQGFEELGQTVPLYWLHNKQHVLIEPYTVEVDCARTYSVGIDSVVQLPESVVKEFCLKEDGCG